jgi:hypothetical protein
MLRKTFMSDSVTQIWVTEGWAKFISLIISHRVEIPLLLWTIYVPQLPLPDPENFVAME